MSDKEWKGYDWSELAQRFGLVEDLYDCQEEDLLAKIKDFILKNAIEAEPHLREHLALLIKHNNTYQTPVWEGLLKIKNNHTFISMCIPLIGLMWD